jgi:hypothetical protein
VTKVVSQSNGRALHLAPLAGRGRIALAIRVRGSLRKRGRDDFKHARHTEQDVVIPESQDAIIVPDKPLVADHVARAIRVLPAIHFDNKAPFAANQINRVRPYGFLPDELIAVEASRPKPIPQSSLRVRSSLSQASGALGSDLISGSQAETPPHPDCSGRCYASPSAIRPLPARGERLAPPRTIA